MEKTKRIVNKNLLNALITYRGLNLKTLGKRCDPPVTNAALSLFISRKNGSAKLGTQVTEILRPAAADLAAEIAHLCSQDLLDVLFPPVCVDPESVALPITEENHSTLLERKGES